MSQDDVSPCTEASPHLPARYVKLPISWGTFIRVIAMGLTAYATSVLWPLLLLFFLVGMLPVLTSYAAIERIWLKPLLRDGVSEKHEQQKDLAFGHKA